MNVLMMTNTYLPHVGGVANSVSAFTKGLQGRGHRVIVVAPEYKQQKSDGTDVVRIPAIQNFNGSDFSVMLPAPLLLENRLQDFKPDIVHSHHPFLVGSTAVRVSCKYDVPLVYTQHTMYEQYTHYVPVGSQRIKQFVITLSSGYANMADHVIAPSDSVASVLRQRGVTTPMDVIPTGIDVEDFAGGDGKSIRLARGIPENAFVMGHVGRLAPEKNLDFLSKAVAAFLRKKPRAHFIVVGYGPSLNQMKTFFGRGNLLPRVHFMGKLKGRDRIDAYHAMDVFVFSSKSETQGLVVAEAMAARVPVVALDAAGVREVVRDGVNGYLLPSQDRGLFVRALAGLHDLPAEEKRRLHAEAAKTAANFSVDSSVDKLLSVYGALEAKNRSEKAEHESVWKKSVEQLKTEWDLFVNLTAAIGDTI